MKYRAQAFFRSSLTFLAVVSLSIGSLALMTTKASAADDQLTQLNLDRLAVFTSWLAKYQVPGVIGEVGWPGDRSDAEQEQWNALANRWYQQAAAMNVPVAYWGVNEASFLDPYQNGRANAQISVIKNQGVDQRGLNMGGGEYSWGTYPSQADITKAAASGITWVRLPFRWETLQPTSGGTLDATALAKLKVTVNQILDAGMNVEIDNHNYNRYNGSTATASQVSSLWTQLAPNFTDNRVSFGLMNEPYPPADANWPAISQTVLTAIRNTGSTNLITVSGKFWSNAHRWTCSENTPTPWITDPANNYRYEAHTYFDANTEGHYDQSYNDTYNAAGKGRCTTLDAGGKTPPSPGGSGPPSTTTTSTTTAPTSPTTSPSNNSTTTTAQPSPGATTTTVPSTTNTSRPSGYRVVDANGHVTGFGDQAATYGDTPGGIRAVAIVNTPNADGYWLATADGRVFARGGAGSFGDMGGKRLNSSIVGLATTPTGAGYWLLGADGGIFSFGDAQFFGSTGSIKLNAPVVSMTATASGRGYWFVATDGGVFAYGDAQFAGSMGGKPLNKPVVGMAANPAGSGYWLVASDGGIFAFGPPFYGSTGSMKLNAPIVGMGASPAGDGYRFVASDGGVFAFGNAPFAGSLGGQSLTSPVVSMTA